MDVFLDEDVQRVDETEILNGVCEGGILMTLNRRIRNNAALLDYFAGKPTYTVGNYIIIDLKQ